MANFNEKLSTKRALNNECKEEYKSFSVLKKILEGKKNTESMKQYLNAYDLKFENLIDIEYLKRGLNMHTFTTQDGKTYETICRKNKDGEIVPAKWSFWLIQTAAEKVRKEELKKVFLEKEKSIKAIEATEKKQPAKRTTKKAA
nr:MAG TPA_asm: hypothetical protein [Caudoviricetes sp.]